MSDALSNHTFLHFQDDPFAQSSSALTAMITHQGNASHPAEEQQRGFSNKMENNGRTNNWLNSVMARTMVSSWGVPTSKKFESVLGNFVWYVHWQTKLLFQRHSWRLRMVCVAQKKTENFPMKLSKNDEKRTKIFWKFPFTLSSDCLYLTSMANQEHKTHQGALLKWHLIKFQTFWPPSHFKLHSLMCHVQNTSAKFSGLMTLPLVRIYSITQPPFLSSNIGYPPHPSVLTSFVHAPNKTFQPSSPP